MARGEALMRFCAFCREPAGKYRRDQYEHARDKHGAKALTKAKALELYPSARMLSDLTRYMNNESVWVFEEKENGLVTIYVEDDLFKVQLPADPSSMTPVPAESPFKPPDRLRVVDAVNGDSALQVALPRRAGLLTLQQRLTDLRDELRKTDALLSEILEGA